MKKNTFLSLAMMLIIGIQLSYAQAPDWTRVLQTNTFGLQYGKALDADTNNIYMAGDFSGPLTFDGSNYTSIGYHDMILTKITNSGVVVWTKQFNAQSNGYITPNAIKVDANQNIYVTGAFSGTITIGSSTITTGNGNSFVAMFDINGNGLWVSAFSAQGNGVCKIAVDSTSNCYLINKGILIKFNNSGVEQWEQSYYNNSYTLNAIAVYGSNLYIGGMIRSATTFGTLTLYSLGGYNTGYLLRADLNGVYTDSLVVRGAHSYDGSSVSDIIMDNAGNLIITGGYTRELILDTITITNSINSYYTYIAKCNSNFVFAWAKSSTETSTGLYRQIWTYRLFSDNLNNIYEYGTTGSSFNYGSIPVDPNGGQFIVTFDTNGNSTNSEAMQNTSYDKIFITPAGKILSTGSFDFEGVTTFGNFYLSQHNSDMTLDWQKSSSGSQSGTVKVNYVIHDSIGNTYLQSRIRGYCNYFGTIINTNNSLTVISKYDITGNLLWINQIADISPDLFGVTFTLDKDNNVITEGLFQTSITISSTTLTSSNTGAEAYVAKYSSTGAFLWASKLNLSLDIPPQINLTTDNTSNVLVTGVIEPSANFIVKFDALGTKLWAKSYPMDSYYCSLISTDVNNNIYLTSEIHLSDNTGSAQIDNVTLVQTYNDGATALIKFDPNGNALWARTYGGVTGATYSDGWPCDIKTDTTGNVYIWGWCVNNAIFGATTLTNPFTVINNNYFFFLAKINSLGNVEWVNPVYEKKYDLNYGDLLDLDKNGNIYIGGHFKDSINISGTIYIPLGPSDFFVTKYSNNGIFQWIKTIPSYTNRMYALSVFCDDILTVVGSAGNLPTLGTFPILQKGGSSCIIATLGNLPSEINEINYNSYFNLYPNPNSGKFKIEMKDVKSKTENVEIQISNLLGERISTISHFELQVSNEVDISALPQGIYFIKIYDKDNSYTEKIIIQ